MMGRHFKVGLILALTIVGLYLVFKLPGMAPAAKDASRLVMDDAATGVTDSAGGKTSDDRLPGAGDRVQDGSSAQFKPEPGWPRREAMAVEGVLLAQSSCGIELTELARSMIARDKAATARRFADQRAVLATLWRETFACNSDFAGQNCFVARWQLCQQAYAEYGPDGIRLKGLIKAIVKK
ncbi:MAG: hypothetical protein HKN11_06570 [Rhizobiales bacterium]|nr:hypothetical protein [Hyphomicrobiales bacterium]